MAEEKDRFGDTMKLVERAKEDIYFAERDREVLARLREQLKKVDKSTADLHCPKCPGLLETYSFEDHILERCRECGGVWMDKGELEEIIHKLTRGPLGAWVDKLISKVPE